MPRRKVTTSKKVYDQVDPGKHSEWPGLDDEPGVSRVYIHVQGIRQRGSVTLQAFLTEELYRTQSVDDAFPTWKTGIRDGIMPDGRVFAAAVWLERPDDWFCRYPVWIKGHGALAGEGVVHIRYTVPYYLVAQCPRMQIEEFSVKFSEQDEDIAVTNRERIEQDRIVRAQRRLPIPEECKSMWMEDAWRDMVLRKFIAHVLHATQRDTKRRKIEHPLFADCHAGSLLYKKPIRSYKKRTRE